MSLILSLGRLLFGPKLLKSLHKDIVKYTPLGVYQEILSLGMIFLDTLFAESVYKLGSLTITEETLARTTFDDEGLFVPVSSSNIILLQSPLSSLNCLESFGEPSNLIFGQSWEFGPTGLTPPPLIANSSQV